MEITDITRSPELNALVPKAELGKDAPADFAEDVKQAIAGVQENLVNADKNVAGALIGDGSPHQMILALTRADLSFRMLTRVRNKLVEAYREIMRMQM